MYQVGQLYSVAEASKNETGGGEGIEVVKNEPFENFPLLGGQFTKGQYTYKIYHLASKVPPFIRLLAPKGSMEIHEEAWNAYPYCKTATLQCPVVVFQNPDYMKGNFFISIETMHSPDRGDQENILITHHTWLTQSSGLTTLIYQTCFVSSTLVEFLVKPHLLPPEKLKQREVIVIDIAKDPVSHNDYKETEDPAKFKSQKTGRGPLVGNWQQTVDPVMCAYKLVTIEFKWFGLQNKVESFLQRVSPVLLHVLVPFTNNLAYLSGPPPDLQGWVFGQGLGNDTIANLTLAKVVWGQVEKRIFLNFHRQVFCWLDKWHGMTMQDIRELEDKTKRELDE
ncbi:PITPNB, partial [Cordylochernes scorpioides]